MPRYLVSIHRPDDYDPAASEDAAMRRDIDALNGAMMSAGVRVFVGGLHPAPEAKSLRRGPAGDVLTSSGPYLASTEHVGGVWVLEASNVEEALEWGRKAAIACRASVEVRQFH